MLGTDFQKVTLRCANEVADSILDRFGKSTKLEPVDDDCFRIEVDVAVSNIFYSWIFGYGGKVRIEGPEDVKEEYKQMIQDALGII